MYLCKHEDTCTVARHVNIESPNFDVLCLRFFFLSAAIILYSPNGTDFHAFVDYLSTSHINITSSSSYPNSGVLYLVNLNIYNTESFGSSYSDPGGKEAESFSFLNDLEQLNRDPIHIPKS